jgi:hypothetical protein
MVLIGVDYHPSIQTIAYFVEKTGLAQPLANPTSSGYRQLMDA